MSEPLQHLVVKTFQRMGVYVKLLTVDVISTVWKSFSELKSSYEFMWDAGDQAKPHYCSILIAKPCFLLSSSSCQLLCERWRSLALSN